MKADGAVGNVNNLSVYLLRAFTEVMAKTGQKCCARHYAIQINRAKALSYWGKHLLRYRCCPNTRIVSTIEFPRVRWKSFTCCNSLQNETSVPLRILDEQTRFFTPNGSQIFSGCCTENLACNWMLNYYCSPEGFNFCWNLIRSFPW